MDITQQLINGLMFGAFYALIGIGFTIFFGVMKKFNLAYGPVIMLGMYAGLTIVYGIKGPIGFVFLAAILGSVVAGLFVERACFRYLRKGHELAPLMTTIGMLILIEEGAVAATAGYGYEFPSFFGDESLQVGPFLVRPDYLAILGAGVCLVTLLYLVIHRTSFGRAIRAVAENPAAAQLLGVNLLKANTLTFILTAALGGATGFFVATSIGAVKPDIAAWMTIRGLVVIVLGGLGSFPGAVLGGLLLGVVEFQAVWFLGIGFRDIFAFIILFAFLVLRPQGFMGKKLA
jgi:branched-subunit amino acid ABC-type transport system permease component